MYINILIILIIIFLILNFYLVEKFSNTYQDTDIRAKLSHLGTNLDEEKPLLTLYYDRREPNCKYFYDYFSTNYGGLANPPVGDIKFSGKSQAWNQIKEIYAKTDTDTEYPFINSNFLKIEEIEVKDGHLYDFNNLPAFKVKEIDSDGNRKGYIEYQGDKPKEYKQYYKPDNFLNRIPKLVLTFFKHKSRDEVDEIIENNLSPSFSGYDDLKNFQKYEYYVIEYDGLYSPNNRQIKTTLDNINKFINDTFEEYLLCPNKESHQSRIDEDANHKFTTTGNYTKCEQCSEYIKTEL
jgi:hypothetical protein